MNEMDDFLDALRDPFWLAKEYTESRKRSDAAHQRRTEEQLASYKRMGEHIDSVRPVTFVIEG